MLYVTQGVTVPIHYDDAPSMDAACSRAAHEALLVPVLTYISL